MVHRGLSLDASFVIVRLFKHDRTKCFLSKRVWSCASVRLQSTDDVFRSKCEELNARRLHTLAGVAQVLHLTFQPFDWCTLKLLSRVEPVAHGLGLSVQMFLTF